MPGKIIIQQVMPLLALRGLTVFPNMILHFDVGREKSVKALDSSLKEGQPILLAAQKDIRDEDPTIDEIYKVGTVSEIKQIVRLPGGNVRLLVEGKYRAKIIKAEQTEPHFTVLAEEIEETSPRVSAKRIEALMREAQDAFLGYAEVAPRMTPEVITNVRTVEEPGYLADYIAQNIAAKYTDKQEILEQPNKIKRLERLCVLLRRETEILETEIEINTRVREQLGRNQRDYFLREQLRLIQHELGEAEPNDDASGYEEKIRALGLKKEHEEKLLKELSRLSYVPQNSSEAAVIKTYLDTCLELPWNTTTQDRIDLEKIAKAMDADHYGLEKVKNRILEFMAVKQLAPDIKGQIICLVGPPGVGKTSIAMSLAGAIGRRMSRLSLGGVHDEAEIRGHRRTYVGAMPGRIINAIRQAGSKNALILLDEIDKLGSDYRGDPASALLEVLDSEQNSTFMDHYIEIPFDLSEVLFVTTANTLNTIPRPLLDRMEVIEISSYTDEEKVQIIKRHILPKQMKRHGLSGHTLRVTDGAIREAISCYAKESGVRQLEREIASICRKAAKMIVSGEAKRVTVTAGKIESFLGPRKYKPESMHRRDEIGVVCGLAWTSVGGEILEVEVSVIDGDGRIELTGNLGNVMKESVRIAISCIRSRAKSLGIDPDFHKKKDIHIHFPEGAVPKDGPSAGITVATAIVSALTSAPVYGNIAMTGEISLRGRVLPIGGLREKTMAAYRNGIRTVIIPTDNLSDLEEIDKTVRQAMSFITVDTVDKVFSAAIDFAAASPEPIEECEEKEISAPKDNKKPVEPQDDVPPLNGVDDREVRYEC